MIYVSFVEIIKKSNDSFTLLYDGPIIGEIFSSICFFIGIIISAIIDKIIPKDLNHHEPKTNLELEELKADNKNP